MASASEQPASMGIELIELETFIAVAQDQSFSAAAHRLHVTQPTVTGRIQRLEEALGVQLLRRTTRKVETTAQGERLLAEAKRALSQISQLVYGFRRQATLEREKVIIAATPTLAASTLPKIIQAYRLRYPDVEVEMLDLLYEAVLEAIADGTADVGVAASDGPDPRFRFKPLWMDHMVLVVPREHPLAAHSSVSIDVLAGHPLLLVGQYKVLRAKVEATIAERGLQLPASRVVGNLHTLLGMLDAGMGITLLPRAFAERPEISKHSLIEISDVDLTRSFGILLSKRGRSTTAKLSFCRFLEEAMPAFRDGLKPSPQGSEAAKT